MAVERARASRWSTTPDRAAGRLERLRRRFGDRADAVVFGHSHLPLHERAEDGFQIFNPGSPTERRRAPAPHDGPRRASRASSSIAFELIDGQHRGRHGPRRPLRRHRRAPRPAPGAACPPRSCGAAATACCSTAARAPSASCVRSTGLVELEDIFLTHFHADHVLGLPGMLKTFALRQRERPLTVYGPAGLRSPVRRACGRSSDGSASRSSWSSSSPTRSSSATATGSPPTRPTTASAALGLRARRGPAPGRLRPRAGRGARRHAGPRLRAPPGGRDGRAGSRPTRSWASRAAAAAW